MKIKTLLYSTIFSVLALHSYGQKAGIVAADKKYERYAYVDAIAIYERVAEKGYKDEKMFQKLGNAYYFNAELPQAEKWYGELFAMNPNQEPEYYYRYSQTLKSVGNYAKANMMLEEFNKKSGNDLRAKLYENNKNYLEIITANSGRFDIADLGINSASSDYGSSFLDNKLVFASARDTGGVSKKVFSWTNQSFTDIYTSEIKAGGEMGKPERFSKKINSKFHESTPVFTNDGQTMYFTRNNYLNSKKGKDNKSITLLKLYKATLTDNQWGNVTELPFNSNDYSVAHPALSLDEKTLYFASDMPGTLGQSDLFSVKINSDGSYGVPMNLGKTINTEGRESFPFISGDNELYFASDGHPGLGGLDVFVSKIGNDNSFGEVQNVGAPINSSQDDFAFLIDSKNRNGFFSSNRSGGKGYDDIYRFLEMRKLICEQLLSGIITDRETGAVLADSKVSLYNEKMELITTTTTDDKGSYKFDVVCGKIYSVRAEKKDYETKEERITINNATGKTVLSLQLEQRIKPIDVGTDLAKTLNIPIIYFDLDKSFIRKEAAFELEKVLAVMQQYPKMKIDVRSHTDSRATFKYNIALSNRRAKSTIAWLVKNGISSSRLTGKGYGESQLVNHCSDGVKCTEEEHQANRRSEFVIVSMQ
ncbi:MULTISPECIES: OmpA family protein [unclassified Flavobacterium]|uniref:OmpA family protein n=1 Tax=unclassified Flavobacterium TaxID=196869 RepID=UPI00057EBB61|nr:MULTISPECIES: OmpA family protein [unclassified Flavobacterium]KIA92145.1 flagellar motor protein MotB [Flavobacterium sp. KMS]MEA9412833.1 OmpA family protein [Flavobacterium sp. PL02]OUL62559.1 flagellar motor protein MotB [Flavobacterium sp. AJR]